MSFLRSDHRIGNVVLLSKYCLLLTGGDLDAEYLSVTGGKISFLYLSIREH